MGCEGCELEESYYVALALLGGGGRKIEKWVFYVLVEEAWEYTSEEALREKRRQQKFIVNVRWGVCVC